MGRFNHLIITEWVGTFGDGFLWWMLLGGWGRGKWEGGKPGRGKWVDLIITEWVDTFPPQNAPETAGKSRPL